MPSGAGPGGGFLFSTVGRNGADGGASIAGGLERIVASATTTELAIDTTATHIHGRLLINDRRNPKWGPLPQCARAGERRTLREDTRKTPPDEVRLPVPGVIVTEGLRLHGVWWCAREREHKCRTDALRGLNIDPAMHRSHAVVDN